MNVNMIKINKRKWLKISKCMWLKNLWHKRVWKYTSKDFKSSSSNEVINSLSSLKSHPMRCHVLNKNQFSFLTLIVVGLFLPNFILIHSKSFIMCWFSSFIILWSSANSLLLFVKHLCFSVINFYKIIYIHFDIRSKFG